MATKPSPSGNKSRTSTCLCSPTNHPGSFRCSRHRITRRSHRSQAARPASSYWELAVAARANSLKAFFLQIIKPSCHHLQRRRNFQPKPSRFWRMNRDSDGDGYGVAAVS